MSGKQPKRHPRPGIDEYGRTPLHYAMEKADVPAVVALLEGGAALDAQDDNGWSALHFAAQWKRPDVAQVLLERGANPNLTDRHGNGPLWTAVMNARNETTLVELLLTAGANADHKNAHGRSPRMMATTIGHGLEAPFESVGETA